MITLKSDVSDLLQVFMAFGLAEVLEQSREEPAFIWWDENGNVNLGCGDATISEAARAVKDQAELVGKSSWIADRVALGVKMRATLSPRVGRFEKDRDYLELQKSRWSAIDSLDSTRPLEWRLVGALGEPAFWWVGPQKINPDAGASAWEMKTRNRGEEFVQNRFAPLTASVARREWLATERGLTGESEVDEVGKNSRESRTPTGLRRPGATDNAAAWCALVGLGITGVHPKAPGTRDRRPASATFGSVRVRNSENGTVTLLYVPIPTRPVSLSRVREAFRSQQLQDFVVHSLEGGDARSGAEWLFNRGIGGVMIARKHFTDNPNAPEPWAVPYSFETTSQAE